jgi:two-component system, NtrC family, sensor histidine kinase PilS
MARFTPRPIGPPTVPSDLAWRVMGLVNLYRLLVAVALLVASALPTVREGLAVAHPAELRVICSLYLLAGLALILLRRVPGQRLRVLALTHATVDSVTIGYILWALGGISSGFGVVILLPIGAMALLAETPDAFLMAAIATIALLLQEVANQVSGFGTPSDYALAGVVGGIVFLAALSVRPLAQRLRDSEALVRRRELDLANLAQLSQYIVQHLRESILVVDAEDRIRLINESAATLLGPETAVPDALLGETSPRLLYLLSSWRQRSTVATPGAAHFPSADGTRLVEPHFASLGGAEPGPVLVFLEDTSRLAERVQQSKLAALGRLSASIAHEIRNPVGAMSHAAQLLAESRTVGDEDRRLTQIMRGNAERVSRIIENVLEFSRRGTSRPEQVTLARWTEGFREEFCTTLQLPETALLIEGAPDGGDCSIRVDPGQLQQVVWNLCENAVKHGGAADGGGAVELRYGRFASNGRPYLEIADRGPGIPIADAERIFEPFFTRSTRGTGLGLFLARELAQTNGATLLYEPRSGGGSLFRLVFTDPGRWGADSAARG